MVSASSYHLHGGELDGQAFSIPEFNPSLLRRQHAGTHTRTFTARQILPAAWLPYLQDRRVLALLCLLCPPVAVFLFSGLNRRLAFSIGLWMFFFIPVLRSTVFFIFHVFGVFFAFYVVFLEKFLSDSANTFDV